MRAANLRLMMAYEGFETRYRCDQCGRRLSVQMNLDEPGVQTEVTLPWPWRKVQLAGWAGTFHACSEKCTDEIRSRYER